MRALRARGARQDLQDECGMTALHTAARNGRASVVELLCAAPGLQVDAPNDLDDTPLILTIGNL